MPDVNSGFGGWLGALRKNKIQNHLSAHMIDGFAYHKIVFDSDGKPVDYVFLEVNDAFERLTGLSREKIVGRRVTEVLPGIEKDPADWIGVYGKVASTGEPVKFENYIQALGKWFMVSAYCPEKGYFVAIFEEITKRKQAEEALKENEKRLNRSQEIAHLGSWELDLTNNQLSWSDEVYRIFGLRPQEFGATYEAFLDAVHPDDRAAVDGAFSGSLRDGRDTYEIEHRVVRKSTGEIRVVHEKCEHMRDGSGKIVRSVGMVQDITESKKAEEALKKSEEEHSSLFASMMDGFAYCQMIFDEGGKPVDFVYLQINDAFERITGLKRDLVVGKKVTEAIPGIKEANPELFEIYGRVAVTCQKEKFEIFFKPLSLWLSVSVYCPRKGYFAAVFEDITERKNSEAEIARLASFPGLNPNSVVEVDFDGNIQYANPATETTFADLKKSGLKHSFFSNWQQEVTTLRDEKKSTFSREQEIGEHWYYQHFTFFPTNQHVRIYTVNIDDLKKAEGALRESEQRWVTTLSSIGDAVIATDVSGKVTFMNAVAEELTGWALSEASQKPIKAVFNIVNEQTRVAVEDPVSKVLEKGMIVGLANHTVLIRKDKTEVAIDDSGAPIIDKEGKITGVVLVFRDITERKKAEDAIRQSEVKFRTVSDFTYDWEYWIAPDGKMVYVSPSCKRVTGYDADEFVKDPKLIGKIVHPEDKSLVESHFDLINSGELVGIDFRIITRDGEVRWISHACKAVFDNEDKWIGRRASNRDITERKRDEENLRRFNRTLRAISNSNQALMRARGEATFLQEACRIIAEDCGYTMVWVGFAEDDEAKTVRPIAYAGFEKGYLDSLKITWADTERGRGPTGRAIRSGLPQFCENMQTDSSFKPWREDALKRGYASSIVLPLKSGDKVFGAITMYAKELHSCSEDEVKLLTELSNDFSYGITMLRLRAEKERTEAEVHKQAALIDLSPDAIIVRELGGKVSFWSKGAEKLYGWEKEEAIGQNSYDLLKTKFPEPYENIVNKLRQTGKWSGELIHSAKDGSQVTVQSWWQPKLDPHGEVVELMESNVDITQRKRSEQAIQRVKVEWERTFDSVPDLIAILDSEHRIVRANKAMAQALSTTPEQCVGLNCYTCVHGTNSPPDFCPHTKTVKDGLEHTEEVHEPRLGGDFLVSTTPLLNEEGLMIGSVHVARNISTRKQMEKKLEEYARHLEDLVEERTQQLRDAERLSAIGETAGMVGHDLRNPLQTVTGETYLAKTELKLLPDSPARANLEENVQIIAEQISYMDKIVSDLQDFVRPVIPDKKPVNLAKLLNATIAEVNIPKNIEVITKINQNLKEIPADAQLLKRVFINLVTNAVQAMPKGGQLTVKTQKKKTIEGKSRIFIHVEDTGVGIPENVKPKIFRPLFTTKSKGQGFGLAVCQRVIEAHRGTITFQSQEGKGAKFTVELPT